MTEMLLELQAVEVSHGQVRALSSVNLAVPRRRIVSLLGDSTSSESTTMKTILGLVRPNVGRVSLDGKDITIWPTSHRVASGIASVSEARRIFASMTVEENLLLGAYTQRDRTGIRDDLAAQYDRFLRPGWRQRQAAGTMSGREQQTPAFIRAPMNCPRLICMGGPTMSLSPRFIDEVLETIAVLSTDLELTVLMVGQQAELALSIAHHGYALAIGNFVLEKPADELLDNPRVQEAYLGRTARNGGDDDNQT